MGVKGNGMKAMRSFSKPENKKLGNFLIVACTVLSLCILSLVKAHYCPAPHVNSQDNLKFQVSEKASLKMVTAEAGDDSFFQDDEDGEEGSKPATNKIKPLCYQSSMRSDTCESEGDVRIKQSTKTVFISNSPSPQEVKIRPYTRKNDPAALNHVKEWTLKPFPKDTPQCTKNYSSPAIIFSTGGFTGNLFHDYTDVLIPLFITSRKFKGDVHFLVSDTKPWWVGRFSNILKQLSNYEVIDMESNEESANDTTLCFPKMIIGPIFHNELGVDATKAANHSMLEFKALVRNAFGLSRVNAMSTGAKPKLLIIARKKSRTFVNLQGIVAMASSIGFDVRIGEPDLNTDVAKFARLVNSADVMLGVHGAGLTNMVYLPVGAVVIQVIPIGGLRWLAKDSFEEPSSDMGLKYIEYLIKEEESTLIEQYPRDHEVIKDPLSIHKKGWNALRDVYLDKQNVRIHLGRLRNALLTAIKLLPQNS